MAITAGLHQKQSQSLAMTPQLAQSIKLLQLSNAELLEFIHEEIEKNPLLELDMSEAHPERREEPNVEQPKSDGDGDGEVKKITETVSSEMSISASENDADLDTSFENIYDEALPNQASSSSEQSVSKDYAGTSSSNIAHEDDYDLMAHLGDTPSLAQHLERQIAVSFKDERERKIAIYIAHGLDEDGYFREELSSAARTHGIAKEEFHAILKQFQTLEPVGIGARNLAECLKLQLIEKNRFDPAIECLIDNLSLLAKHEFDRLRKLCGVCEDDFNEMVLEIKSLDPRPAAKYEPVLAETVVPDVIIKKTQQGNWGIELNSSALPRVLVNNEYYTELRSAIDTQEGTEFIATCMQNANWLTKSLHQRAQTILKVAEEIVRQQDMFFEAGIEHLRPLNLKVVAEAIKMHESTISRVTANKYLLCDQGIFELKYFFSSTITSSDGEEGHSAETVKHKIKLLVDGEDPKAILSDDKLVIMLQETGIEIARRTVAKYREAMRIPSSVQRRREKKFSA